MTSGENDKNKAPVIDKHQPPPPPPPHQGMFQGVAYNPPPPHPQPPMGGFPQPTPPSGVHQTPSPQQFPHDYQTAPGYAVAEGRPVDARDHRLPCCGLGIGWFLFIIGFFLGAIPWYIGAFVLLFARIDPREKPGYIACIIAALIATISIVVGVTKGAVDR